jgi:signal transduction histidine kinase
MLPPAVRQKTRPERRRGDIVQPEHNFIEISGPSGKERPHSEPGELVLLCGRQDFCSEARHELGRRRKDLRIAAADGIAGARQILGEQSPAVILAEERVLAGADGDYDGSLRSRLGAIESALSLLAVSAPVVWIGPAEEGPQVTKAVRSGAVDFVPRSALCVPAAVTMVERRLRCFAKGVPARRSTLTLGELRLDDREFGEVLRHELNNPLTGILGNAELLLLETRRGQLDVPLQTLQRLETIAELAVRMRETVRHLSDRWEAAAADLAGGQKNAGDPPGRPFPD